MSPRPTDYKKFADDQVRYRQQEEGLARLRLGLFIAVLGPVILVLSKFTGFPTMSNKVMLAVYATIPLGLLVLAINYIRLASHAKGTKFALSIIFMTIAVVIVTLVLPRILFPAAALPPS